MKNLFFTSKDGGKESTVYGFWIAEFKKLFSIVLLRFEGESREAYHNHAFNSISWVLKGKLTEQHYGGRVSVHTPSLIPIVTLRDTFHKVHSSGTTIVLSFRGPWVDFWHEYVSGEKVTLTHGRKIVA